MQLLGAACFSAAAVTYNQEFISVSSPCSCHWVPGRAAVLCRDLQLALSKQDQEQDLDGCVRMAHLLRDWAMTDLSCFPGWSLCTSLYVIATTLRDSLGMASMMLPWGLGFWRPKWF